MENKSSKKKLYTIISIILSALIVVSSVVAVVVIKNKDDKPKGQQVELVLDIDTSGGSVTVTINHDSNTSFVYDDFEPISKMVRVGDIITITITTQERPIVIRNFTRDGDNVVYDEIIYDSITPITNYEFTVEAMNYHILFEATES